MPHKTMEQIPSTSTHSPEVGTLGLQVARVAENDVTCRYDGLRSGFFPVPMIIPSRKTKQVRPLKIEGPRKRK